MIMNIKQKKIKLKPRIKLNYNIFGGIWWCNVEYSKQNFVISTGQCPFNVFSLTL